MPVQGTGKLAVVELVEVRVQQSFGDKFAERPGFVEIRQRLDKWAFEQKVRFLQRVVQPLAQLGKVAVDGKRGAKIAPKRRLQFAPKLDWVSFSPEVKCGA